MRLVVRSDITALGWNSWAWLKSFTNIFFSSMFFTFGYFISSLIELIDDTLWDLNLEKFELVQAGELEGLGLLIQRNEGVTVLVKAVVRDDLVIF